MSQHPNSAPDRDADRWTRTWEIHHAEIVRYVTSLLGGDVYTAEDVAQETAVRLWQRRDTMLDDQPLGPWLRTVARNIVIDRHRRRRARPTEVAFAASVDPAAPDPTHEVEAAMGVEVLLAGLPDHHRDAVLEVYVNDRPVAQAAQRLGVPPGTVKSRCHHALRRLRAQAPLDRCA